MNSLCYVDQNVQYWFSVKLSYHHKHLNVKFITEVITCTIVKPVVIIVGLIHHTALVHLQCAGSFDISKAINVCHKMLCMYVTKNFIQTTSGTALRWIMKKTNAEYELCRLSGSFCDCGKLNPF